MDSGLLMVCMFGAMIILMVLGLPLAFVMGSIGMVFLLALRGIGGMILPVLMIWSWMQGFVLIALPLFIFMGALLEKAGIADEMLDMMYRWLGPMKGGLAIGVILICVVFAAMQGASGPATVTLGILAIPPLLKRKYDQRLVTGSIMAGGALGFLIPPSIVFILYGMMAKVSIGRLFAGGVFPGLLLALLYCIYIAVRSYLQPHLAPALPLEERFTMRGKLLSLRAVAAPFFVIFSVLITVFLGVVSPSEGSALGVASVFVVASLKRKLTLTVLKEALYRTARLCAMVMWIAFGALTFAAVYDILGGVGVVKHFFTNLHLSPMGVIYVMWLSYFIAGCFMDDLAFLMMVMPIYLPIAMELGFDPIWFGVTYCMTSQMAFITPPFGYNLFYMTSVTRDLYRTGDISQQIKMEDIYRSVVPFVALQMVGLIIVGFFPQLALWLPNRIFGGAQP